MKEKLDQELMNIQFSEAMKEIVLSKGKPSFWDREIVIPIPVATLILFLYICISIFSYSRYTEKLDEQIDSTNTNNRTVVLDTGVFLEKDLIERSKR